jgi:hypothetical protein
MDDRIIRTDWDAGFVEGRQYGRGKSGGQVDIFCRKPPTLIHPDLKNTKYFLFFIFFRDM